MNRNEIKEFNLKCVKLFKFEEYEIRGNKSNDFIVDFKNGNVPLKFSIASLLFHYDWDWIMELINYIENKLPDSYNVDIVNKNQCEIVKNGHELISTGGFDKVNISKKEAIIEVINKFLDKYNDIEKNK
jgi:hypothetical protein